MKRWIILSLFTAPLILAGTAMVLAACGNPPGTWVVSPPTFGPAGIGSSCLVAPGGIGFVDNPTTTSKSVATAIHWADGFQLNVVVTDSGQNRAMFDPFENCIRCFPEFETPYFVESGNTATWTQYTRTALADATGLCLRAPLPPNLNSYPHTCPQACNPSAYTLMKCQTVLNGDWDYGLCKCVVGTPVLIDVSGDGFSLTDYPGGVDFDLDVNGTAEHLSWTAPNSDDAFLAYDRNDNGRIDDGRELFGSSTPQFPSDEPNGFKALAEYDRLPYGGNGDGVIDQRDTIYSRLVFWQDFNHNGVSEPGELHNAQQLGLGSIDLDYKESRKTDQYGNHFQYRAKVSQGDVGKWAWDVVFVSRP